MLLWIEINIARRLVPVLYEDPLVAVVTREVSVFVQAALVVGLGMEMRAFASGGTYCCFSNESFLYFENKNTKPVAGLKRE